jgi:hypothetical protein
MTPENPPTEPAPPVKEPPKDDPSGGPRPKDDIQEPQLDRKKIAEKPKDDPLRDDDVRGLPTVTKTR